MSAVIDALAIAALAWIALEDIARFRIRNSLVVLLAALYGLRILASGGGPDLVWHVAFATAALLVMLGLFALGGVGAGDAKLTTVACLWIGPDRSLAFALLLLSFTLIAYLFVKLRWMPVRHVGRRTKIPFGPSIALSWIVTILALPQG